MPEAQIVHTDPLHLDVSRPLLGLRTALPEGVRDAPPDVTAMPPAKALRKKAEKLVLPDVEPSSREWMAEIGRRGGLVTSPAKAVAARLNGMKGGRPRKSDAPAARATTLEVVTISAGHSLRPLSAGSLPQPMPHQGIADFMPSK
ncbi:hypothetical protein [Leptothrix discophora]|uniref:Uncharacterized protein n=1 Tax=Leptothrix discophora TaxID=89 RepID=A0ABT9G3C6_LEPDI|nr:hypothetical protein [Leptothrix discophora]MDP4300991.1 hypothetical protein [Leptothrix discophora]